MNDRDASSFQYWMKKEAEYAQMEMEQAAIGRYDEADYCHKMRWRCMDAAVKTLSVN